MTFFVWRMNEDLRERFASLLEKLNEGVYGRQQAVALSLLAAVAGESIFLLGPPGVAKSMVARRLKSAFDGAVPFEYLMSRFSTPDELFGPVAVSKLKDADLYERVVEGYLPAADIAFLDEIWKAGPAIQNALLTILNEKTYRNGKTVLKVPLKGIVAASNELPAVGQGLEALWDRFLIRCMVGNIEDQTDFDRMLLDVDDREPVVASELAIRPDEYYRWQEAMKQTVVPYEVLEVVHRLKELIEVYNQKQQNDGTSDSLLYVSDRRWKKCIRLLRAAAFLNGAGRVHLSDCFLLASCLWHEVQHCEEVEQMVHQAISYALSSSSFQKERLESMLEDLRMKMGSEHRLREDDDPGLVVTDGFYYQVEGVRMRERLLLFVADYKALTDTGQLFCLHKDKYKANCCILKKYDAVLHAKISPSKCYTLKKAPRAVEINGYVYPLVCHAGAAPLPEPVTVDAGEVTALLHRLEEQAAAFEDEGRKLVDTELAYSAAHLFLTEEEKRKVERLLRVQEKELVRFKNELNELKDAFHKENQEYPAE